MTRPGLGKVSAPKMKDQPVVRIHHGPFYVALFTPALVRWPFVYAHL